MEVYAGFLEHTDYHVGRLIDAIERARRARQHAGLLHHRRQRRVRRGHRQRRVQRDGELQRDGRARDARVHGVSKMDKFGSPSVVQPLLGRLGVGDVHARTSGPSRSPRTGAAPATARSSTGRRASTTPGGLRSQFTHVIDVAPTMLEAAGLPEPTIVNGVQQSPMEGTSMVYSFDERRRRGAPRPAVLRDVRQPRHLLPGVERGHQAQHPVGDGRRRPAGLRRRRVGALRRSAD